MHRQPRSFSSFQAPKPKPSRLPVIAVIVVALLLPYLIYKICFAKKAKETVENNITLPMVQHIQDKKEVAPKVVHPLVEPSNAKTEQTVIKKKPETKTQPTLPEKPIAKTKVPENPLVEVTTRSGDSLATIFNRVGLNGKILHAVLDKNKYATLLTHIKPNQSIQFVIKHHELERMSFQLDHGQTLDVVRERRGYKTTLTTPKMEYRERYLTAIVQYSLYSTAKRQNIPYKLIQQMTDIFKREINFAKDIRSGDRFTIIYKAGYMGSDLVSVGDIIAVTYTHRGESHKALRHVSSTGEVDYFTPEGESLKQGFSRYPVKFSHINSAFSLSRMHPVLHYHRPHKGVDLAAPMGTPIFATGDGRIQHLGYENGYGNVIKISHHNALYTSVYAHLSKFKKGLFRGSYVKRGELIGYVGKSGLASGPHCHYEFHVNHRPRNPTTVSLPQAEPVPRRDLASFKRQADKLIEHLKLFEEAHLASKKDKAVG